MEQLGDGNRLPEFCSRSSAIMPCDGSRTSCQLILVSCVQLASFFMDAGLLLTTSHDVYSVHEYGRRGQLMSHGSL